MNQLLLATYNKYTLTDRIIYAIGSEHDRDLFLVPNPRFLGMASHLGPFSCVSAAGSDLPFPYQLDNKNKSLAFSVPKFKNISLNKVIRDFPQPLQ